MYSHGCCIQTVRMDAMDGTFQRKENVTLVSIDVMRRNTDTKISKVSASG